MSIMNICHWLDIIVNIISHDESGTTHAINIYLGSASFFSFLGLDSFSFSTTSKSVPSCWRKCFVVNIAVLFDTCDLLDSISQ
jgi:hypothetical protein